MCAPRTPPRRGWRCCTAAAVPRAPASSGGRRTRCGAGTWVVDVTSSSVFRKIDELVASTRPCSLWSRYRARFFYPLATYLQTGDKKRDSLLASDMRSRIAGSSAASRSVRLGPGPPPARGVRMNGARHQPSGGWERMGMDMVVAAGGCARRRSCQAWPPASNAHDLRGGGLPRIVPRPDLPHW